jgi:hypothetical protein
MRIWMIGCIVGLAAAMAGPSPAMAQDQQTDQTPVHRHAPLRGVVTAGQGQSYRQCTDWHVIEHRVTGDTIVPRIQCRWAPR